MKALETLAGLLTPGDRILATIDSEGHAGTPWPGAITVEHVQRVMLEDYDGMPAGREVTVTYRDGRKALRTVTLRSAQRLLVLA